MELCRIPAPSLHEEERARFCVEYFRRAGFDAFCDGANNAIAPWNVTETNPITVFMAHTDTVFPDTSPLPIKEENGKIYCPGVGDDTANLAILMLAAKLLKKEGIVPHEGILFVANAGEEGLGNLRGSRKIAETYGDRIKAWISFDLDRKQLFVKAVGSARYRVCIETEGGHSYGDFGKESAIALMAKLIGELYAQPIPQAPDTKTTFNVGTISGGTSVNTIAQKAEILYEYRSDDGTCLDIMKEQMEEIFAKYKGLTVESVGFRPGMGKCKNPALQEKLIRDGEASVRKGTGNTPQQNSASTDCNIPFSLGIPALCFGLVTMEGAHTRKEWVETSSLATGLSIALDFIHKQI